MKKQFDFVGKRVILFIIPIVLIAAGVVSFFLQGFNLAVPLLRMCCAIKRTMMKKLSLQTT